MWYVVKSAPGRQIKALEEMDAVGIDAICPMMRREIRHFQTKTWMMRQFPLFSNYVFACLREPVDFDCLRRMDHVVAVLGGTDGPIAIPTTKVQDICEAQNRGDFDVMRPPSITVLRPDSRVYIQSGPLAGHYASVVKPKGKKAIKAVVEALGTAREIELSIANLKLVA
ncbi:transcription termination/antitermination NusG family protein [Neorhizobium sp. DT-125]